MTSVVERALIAVLGTALVCACSNGPPAQILVVANTDFAIPSELDGIVVHTLDGSGTEVNMRRFPLGSGAGEFAMPLSFGIAPVGGDLTRHVTVQIDAMLGRCRLFSTRAGTSFAPNREVRLDVFLARQCAGDDATAGCVPRDSNCDPSRTCGAGGRCVPIERAACTLPDVTRDASLLDAGTTDASCDGAIDAGPSVTPRPTNSTTNGAAIAITFDDRVVVAANRTANSVSVFGLTPGDPWSLAPPTVLSTSVDASGRNAEPWAVVIGNDDDTAFAVLRRERRVIRIDHLHTAPAISPLFAPTGSEPTSLAISPSGLRLYVTNWNDGTLSVINTTDMTPFQRPIDLNVALAQSGFLGAGVAARPALAHPRAIVITNAGSGTDDDEAAYVTEFFGQPGVTGVPTSDPDYWDQARQGVVYRIELGTGAVTLVTLRPVPAADLAFHDVNDAPTGCFPNQLYAAAISNGRVYVTSECASPRGPTGVPMCSGGPACDPRNIQTMVHAVVFVIDTRRNVEIPTERLVLTRIFRDVYDSNPWRTANFPVGRTPIPIDDPGRRMPLLPLGLAFVPNDYALYVPAYGSDAVFRVALNGDGSLFSAGSRNSDGFIDLQHLPNGLDAGHLPAGIAIIHHGTPPDVAVVLNANSRNVSLIDLQGQRVAQVRSAAPLPATQSPEELANDGRRFFVTGTGRFSYSGQSWISCESCHPDGLSDGVTWFFARGPRQSVALDGSFGPVASGTQAQRIFNWTAVFDEPQDLESVLRSVMGGVGAIVWQGSHEGPQPTNADRIVFDTPTAPPGPTVTGTLQNFLNGSSAAISSRAGGGVPAADGHTTVFSAIDDFDRIAAYIRSIRSPRAPTNLDRTTGGDVEAGRRLFTESRCGGCHGTPLWTVSQRFYTPGPVTNVTNGTLRTQTYRLPPQSQLLNPPLANSHDGTAPFRTLFDPMDANGHKNDQINCVLRDVGTFPMDPLTQPGVAPSGGAIVREVRSDMMAPAQGATGFNPPALIGLAAGAPYYHAGNARTLEEAFTQVFHAHASALAMNFLLPADPNGPMYIRQLVAFLLSIDDDTDPVPLPVGALGYNPDLCSQFQP